MSTPAGSPVPFPLRPQPHLYEINTWVWLEQLSARIGRPINLASVPDSEWDALAGRGFNAVWLMGVWRRSAESRRLALTDPSLFPVYDRALPGWTPEDVVGSPYAVAEYIPDARMGDWEGLDSARDKLHARGMALFLDFVGNHTALDHPWTHEHPEYYVLGTQQDFERASSNFYPVATRKGTFYLALGRDPYFPPWRDTAQLNHFNPQMRAAQLADLRTIAAHCDGLRCDMAMLHLNDIFSEVWGAYLKGAKAPAKEFWAEAHAAVPWLILMAEAYWGTEQRLLDLGFSFAYDKGLYDAVRDGNIPDVHARLAAPWAYQSRMGRFLENHDEERRAVVFPDDRLPSVGTLMGTLPGGRLYHQGELEGRKIRIPVQLRRAADEPPDPVSEAFFDNLLRTTRDDVFHHGQWNILQVAPESDDTSGNLVAYEWRAPQSWKVMVVNLADRASQGRLHFGDHVSRPQAYLFHDLLDDARYPRSGEELANLGLFVRREAFQAHLFDVLTA